STDAATSNASTPAGSAPTARRGTSANASATSAAPASQAARTQPAELHSRRWRNASAVNAFGSRFGSESLRAGSAATGPSTSTSAAAAALGGLGAPRSSQTAKQRKSGGATVSR